MNKNQAEGSIEQAKGAVKEAVGKLVGDKRVEAEGRKDQAAGKLQKQIGDAVEVLSDALKSSDQTATQSVHVPGLGWASK